MDISHTQCCNLLCRHLHWQYRNRSLPPWASMVDAFQLYWTVKHLYQQHTFPWVTLQYYTLLWISLKKLCKKCGATFVLKANNGGFRIWFLAVFVDITQLQCHLVWHVICMVRGIAGPSLLYYKGSWPLDT